MSLTADADSFLAEYERRTNAHDIDAWSELIAEDATYWFTNGTHVGKRAIVDAVAYNFRVIEDETYRISDVEWVHRADDIAVVRYRFNWTGLQNGQPASGSGRGTNVMSRRDGRWQMTHEHLSA
ncbi:YybH family protein [Agreia bicolorata]|uniref:Cag pathogenicity island protein Cag4 n=1 Tax=Agreia bicolorata TaxID=110935 RepID=A0ABR5CD76_9MICO|nr:nuclear transport factor 2 family protein [Agreia bicolorata]KJC63549.1 cag pathogenicity island protein Cag4 [Agreia bicolorata]